MVEDPTVKIFVSTMLKLKSICIPSPLYVNVQSGAAFDDYIAENLIGDNTGENISEKNRNYSELSVQYWAWKNQELDYYGMCHYRRFLSFSKKKYDKDVYGFINEEYLDDKNIKKHRLDDEAYIKSLLRKYDMIIKEPSDCTKMPLPDGSFAENELDFWNNQKMRYITNDTIDLVKKSISENYLDYLEDFNNFLGGVWHYGYNLFIMKKELFQEFCEFEFKVIFDVEKETNIYPYGGYLRRIYGYIGEMLFSTYVYHLQRIQKGRIKMVPAVKFNNTSNRDLKPAFDENNVPIVFLIHDYRVPELSVTIQSIIENSSDSHNYDILIIGTKISNESKAKLSYAVKEKINFSLRFVDLSKEYDDLLKGCETKKISEGRYVRLLSPWLLTNYDRVMYLSRDMIILKDVAELFDEDLSEPIGAVVDYVRQGTLNLKTGKSNNYESTVLKMSNPYDYADVSLLVVNQETIRNTYKLDNFIDEIKHNRCINLEPDLINKLFSGKIKKLPISWNYRILADEKMKKELSWMTPDSIAEYGRGNPCILRYSSSVKPWDNAWVDDGGAYWIYARKSQFYEVLMTRLVINALTKKSEKQINN